MAAADKARQGGPSWQQQPPPGPLQKRPGGAPAPGWWWRQEVCQAGPRCPASPRSPRRHQQPRPACLRLPEVRTGARGILGSAPPPACWLRRRTPDVCGAFPRPYPIPSRSPARAPVPLPSVPVSVREGLSPSLPVSAPQPRQGPPLPAPRTSG